MSELVAYTLADWILSRSSSVSHLKLQKLAFYCYGISAATSPSFKAELGHIAFVAWKHGPVNRELYDRFRDQGASPLQAPPHPPTSYSPQLAATLTDVLNVYGRLEPWELVKQSHLEAPWKNTPQSATIDDVAIIEHFAQKYRQGQVRAPEYLSGEWSLNLDGIPTYRYGSLSELAADID